MARYTARILCLGIGTEVREAFERQLTADHLALAKVEALRAAGDVPLADRIILFEDGAEVAVCRLESIVAEWSSSAGVS